ncbi:putative cyclic di-GMP phosphodiesterase PdeB [Methylophilaceae bacterium]|nr:putative cyclic di-GMP phosphodiesterase PdeB [Methylophilaceae bacterium]
MNNLINKIFSKRYTFFYLANFVGILLVSASIFSALMLARHQAEEKEISRLDSLNANVLERMQKTSEQFAHTVKSLSMFPPDQACSEASIGSMQQIAISGGLLQAIGYLKDNQFACSSQAGILNGLDLGTPGIVEPGGVRVWVDITLPKAPGRKYLVIERNGYAAVLLPIDAVDFYASPNTSIGLFDIKSRFFYTSKGLIKAEWIRAYQGGVEPAFIDEKKEYLVSIRPSPSGKTAVLAAIPTSEISRSVLGFAQILIPLGIFFALGLSAIIIYLARHRYSAKSELAAALKNDEFYLEYQPIIDLRTKACIGAEALVRWRQSDGTLVRPDLFIPLAEESGLIRQITKHVLDLITRDMAELLRRYPDFHLGINLSSADLQSEETVQLLETMISEIGPGKGRFVIEATERGFLNDGVAQKVVNSIRNLGMQVAIDDFGTGYSSLSYLTKFELDFLKIDKTFVDVVGTDAVTSHVAFHIIEMAKSLNLKMVAEGIETETQAAILLERGVVYVQGWLFAKSMSPQDLMAYVDSH